MIDANALRRQKQALKRAGIVHARVVTMCDCGKCLRCRKRLWMRKARARLHPGYWRNS